jgi:hypothetical protein
MCIRVMCIGDIHGVYKTLGTPALSMTQTDQVKIYDPLLLSLLNPLQLV